MTKCLQVVGKRFNSCSTKFTPVIEQYKTLRHIHFPGRTKFEDGLKIQQAMVNANIDFKKISNKIIRLQKDIASKGYRLTEYEDGLLAKIMEMKPLPTVLTFEFENVYAGGKQMKQDPQLDEKIEDYRKMGCEYHQLERGGQVTWHGEGQLVAYTILDLKQFKNLTPKCFVDSVLLKSVQNLLKKNYGLSSYLNENPGVWMSESNHKISSIGCNIQHAITSFGIALNVNPDLKYLNTYTMCGLPEAEATSISRILPESKPDVKEVGNQYAKELAQLLNITTVEHMSGEDLKL